jgi:hypothetical protein
MSTQAPVYLLSGLPLDIPSSQQPDTEHHTMQSPQVQQLSVLSLIYTFCQQSTSTLNRSLPLAPAHSPRDLT